MKKLIIAANLGRIRVLKYRPAGDDPIEQAHLMEEPEDSGTEPVEAIHEVVTDQAGRFARGNSVGLQTGMSYGEEHNLALEMERGSLKQIASRISRVLESEGHPAWVLAAPQAILARLRDALPKSARETLTSEVGSDLTQCALGEMEERFL